MSIENPFMNSNEERNPQENLSKFDRIKKIADDGGLPKKNSWSNKRKTT